MGFSPFHAGLMMIPMVLGSMGMKRIVVQVVNRFGYRRVLVAATIGWRWSAYCLWAVALLGWCLHPAAGAVLPGDHQLHAILVDEHPDAERSADELASSGNSLLSMIMQLSMSVGSRLPDCCSACTVSTISAPTPRRASGLYTYLSMAVIISPALFLPECRMTRPKRRDPTRQKGVHHEILASGDHR